MTMTVDDMATAVLREMAVLGSEDVPSAADAKDVKDTYARWLANASKREIVDWYHPQEEIPDGAELGVIYAVATLCAARYGVELRPVWMTSDALLADHVLDRVPAPFTPMWW